MKKTLALFITAVTTGINMLLPNKSFAFEATEKINCNEQTLKSTESAIFKATFDANTFNVAYNSDGGTGSNPTLNKCTYDSTCNAPSSTYSKTGYTFVDWSCTASTGQCEQQTYSPGASISNATTVNNATITLKANWTPVSYSITYNNINGATNFANAPTTYTIETNTITLGTPTKTGYAFGGWYDNAQFTGNAITQITKGSTDDKTLYAKWNANGITLTYKDDNGRVLEYEPQTCTYDEMFNLPEAPEKPGYTFTGWELVNNNN